VTNSKWSRAPSAAQDEEWQLTDEQIAEVQRRTVNPSRKLFSIAEARKRWHHYDAPTRRCRISSKRN
jgi:hypothetical protein